ncbi:MAG: hypothetical protein IJZ34_01110 [Lachnospiraceae bacterium]|nr:hypothetical protein [Lachnospiraceae bacterium]
MQQIGIRNEESQDKANGFLKHRRLINWWVTWNDLNWPNYDGIERIKRKAEKAAKADVTTAILFGAHFRWDYLPYFTLLHDYIATVAEELHKYGIELYDRHSVNLIHRYDTRDEMRHVMLHSGPHLPFSPSREAAASWEYKGKRLNDWRMIDVRNGNHLYYPQYAAEGFCYNNPDYLEAYCDYAKRLVADTGIDGLASEDSVHYMHFLSCACPYCKAELKKRTGIDLPSAEDRNFWGNWDNPHWKAWIDMRYDTGKKFFEKLSGVLPKDYPLITCGANSASYSSTGKACDARIFSEGGSNYVHSEMSGNTPPYKNDPVTANISITDRMVNFSHHQAVAKENGIRSFSTGYGFTEPSANIIWAVNKALDTDCLFSTLKARLGLPDHMLEALPDEADVIGKAFKFEKEHPELFCGDQIGQVGVYYSDETRDHTFFGNLQKGYYKDYARTVRELFSAGISTNTIFTIPKDAVEYPVIILSSIAAMKDDELADIKVYVSNGGKIIVSGPSPIEQCKNSWNLPSKPEIKNTEDFFDTIAYGVWHKHAEWVLNTEIEPCSDPCEWKKVADGIFYNPWRVSDGAAEGMIKLCSKYAKKMPVRIVDSEGYLITAFKSERGIIIHLLAEDYDTDIDHHLDEIRFHRSRVNFVNKADPIGISRKVQVEADTEPQVFTPFNSEDTDVVHDENGYTLSLPEKTAYAILYFAL